jgi:hypothetical protein
MCEFEYVFGFSGLLCHSISWDVQTLRGRLFVPICCRFVNS